MLGVVVYLNTSRDGKVSTVAWHPLAPLDKTPGKEGGDGTLERRVAKEMPMGKSEECHQAGDIPMALVTPTRRGTRTDALSTGAP